jgi:hypothetical protein
LTHVEPHARSPAAQGIWHRPSAQGAPAAHALPHAPQWAGSDARLTQRPLHSAAPAAHASGASGASLGAAASMGVVASGASTTAEPLHATSARSTAERHLCAAFGALVGIIGLVTVYTTIGIFSNGIDGISRLWPTSG